MLEPTQSRKVEGINGKMDGLLYRRPDVDLLDEGQWRYVQRCYRLSPREIQVAKHICQGLDNEEVAKFLKISSGTVKTHLRNIYRRIHVTNKIEMLLTFVEQVIAFYGKSHACCGITAVDSGQHVNQDIGSFRVQEEHKQTEPRS